MGVDTWGLDGGEFFIEDAHSNVRGVSDKRLVIENDGTISPPSDNSGRVGRSGRRWALLCAVNVQSGDFTFENGFKLTEEGTGIAFYNGRGDRVAVLDEEGNLKVKGKVIEGLQ